MAKLVHSFAEIFSNRIFTIPDYQRGYAWGEKQWRDLLQDLELLPDGRDHFTGTLVLRRHGNGQVIDEEGRAYEPFDVIDGQQRLTTVILLMKAIYDEMLAIDGYDKLANGLREMYLSAKSITGEMITRLTLNRDSKDFYTRDVLGASPIIQGPTIRSHRHLRDGKAYFCTYLAAQREKQGAEYPDWLKKLYFKISQHLMLIVYEVESDQDAGVIFETMNDRGRPLTELEKVKNYLLYVSSKLDLPGPTSLAEKINGTWTHIFEELMAVNLSDPDHEDQLLRAHWLTVYDYDQRNWQQSRTIKERFALQKYVGQHAALLQELLKYLETLMNAATAYCDLHSPSRAGSFNEIQNQQTRQEVVYWSEKLARLGARAGFQPILIAVRLKGGNDGSDYLQTVKLCEHFDFRVYQWMRKQPRAGQTQLFMLGYTFFKDANLSRLLSGITETLGWYCTDKQFEQRFSDETLSWYEWSGIKYLLYEYEEYLAQQAGVPVRMPWETLQKSRKEDTIEHILPQALKDPYWTSRFDPEQAKRWTHDIGNLTLTYDNSPLSYKPFTSQAGGDSEKRHYYAKSVLLIEHELAGETEWGPTQIQYRRERFKVWALKRWQVDFPATVASGQPTGNASPRGLGSIRSQAQSYGLEAEYDAILKLAQSYRLHPVAHKWCVVLAPPRRGNCALFAVWPEKNAIKIGFWHGQFKHFYQTDDAHVQKVMGSSQSWFYVDQSNLVDFTTRLESLLGELTLNNG